MNDSQRYVVGGLPVWLIATAVLIPVMIELGGGIRASFVYLLVMNKVPVQLAMGIMQT